ncbi:MAG: hypothetical protein DHS20C01_19410 [marine bacterium B5-7]|nr:MAG: hypothetical protein DHS20C01_19410 [marine bacterium B5-7]
MKIFSTIGLLLALTTFNTGTHAQMPMQMPNLGGFFGGQQQANPFAGQQANAFTNMMAPMGMMGGANPMMMMVNPANWLNPNAYAQFANPMSYMSMMNPMSYMAMMNPMTYLPMMNPNSYIQMMNPALGLAGVQPMGNIAAIDPNTYWQVLVQLLGGIHGQPETSEGFLDKLKEIGEKVAPEQ